MNKNPLSKHPIQALEYMTRFACTGPQCPDTCCAGWRIELTPGDVQRLQTIRDSEAFAARSFADSIEKKTGPDAGPGKYAHMTMQPDGSCAMLNQGLCRIQAARGEQYLPGTCATYPRMVHRFGDGFTLSGLLSCPEAVRLCLTDPHAVRLVDYDWSHLPPQLKLGPAGDGDSVYQREAEAFRAQLLKLLSLPDLSHAQRLYLMAFMARMVSSSYCRDTQRDPGKRLQRYYQQMDDAAHRQKLLDRFESEPGDGPQVQDFLSMILGAGGAGRNHRLYDMVSAAMAQESEQVDLASAMDDPFETMKPLFALYHRRRAVLFARYGRRLEQYFNNFCFNYFFTTHLLEKDSPGQYIAELVLFLTLCKLLLVTHPGLAPLLDQPPPDQDTALALLDQTAAAAVQALMRSYTHNSSFKDTVARAMNNSGVTDLKSIAQMLNI